MLKSRFTEEQIARIIAEQDAMIGAGGELQLLDGGLEQAAASFVEASVFLNLGLAHAYPEPVEGSVLRYVPSQQ